MQSNRWILSAVAAFTFSACEDKANEEIDPQQVAEYRAALPNVSQLVATAPVATTASVIGEPALYPNAAHDVVLGVNGAVAGIVTVLEEVTRLPPTLYDSAENWFVWGPAQHEDGIGTIAAYIQENPPGADFRYTYALLRGIDSDLAAMTPIIWGGATPDDSNNDHGVGVTLWDFEANHGFEEENNSEYVSGDRGRFVALYGKNEDSQDANSELAFVVAVFRNFVPNDNADQSPVDVDYFYGRHESDNRIVDFIDFEFPLDVSETPDGIAEDLGIRMAFVDEGTGRAEVNARGGSLAETERISGVECWDRSLNQTFLEFTVWENDAEQTSFGEAGTGCSSPFAMTLDQLEVPSLDTIENELLSALDQVASNGIPRE